MLDSLFGHLLDEVRKALLQGGFVETVLPAEWALRSPLASPLPVLRSFAGSHPLRGTRWCAAHITGPRAEILNVMIYPRDALRVPVFAVEYIAFGGKPRVAVVDLQPAAGVAEDGHGFVLTSEVVAALKGRVGDDGVHDGERRLAAEIRSALPGGGDLPAWAVPHFTPVCVYSRPSSSDGAEMALLTEAFRLYFHTWRTLFLPRDDGRAATPSELGSEHLAAYQRHHVEHTPGRPFLRKTYGEEWTERYLREFMYANQSLTP
jgi:hypothetical protein